MCPGRIAREALQVLPMLVLLALPRSAAGQSPAAHWKLNESSGTSAADASGNGYTGTVTGTATWTSGVIDNCFSFNGATRIQATGLVGNPANATLATWANLTSADSSGAEVISLGDCFAIRLDSGGWTNTFFYNGSTWLQVGVNQTYAGTGWHHFAAVMDDANNTLKLYVDGSPVASLSTTASISYSGLGSNTLIGRHGNGSGSFDFTGTVDDVRVYNSALSDAQILELYGKLAHWKLNESSGTSAADSSAYNRTGTVTGTASWGSAVLGNGFSFNGSTRIQANGLMGSPSSFSLAAWANLTAADSSGAEVISIGNRVLLRLDDGTVTRARFWNGSSYVDASVTANYEGTGWHHFAATFDNPGNSFKLYVDGEEVASTSTTSSPSYSGSGSNTVIGRHGNSSTSYDFTGMIDDVRVYNYALSESDVAELYGLIGHWKLAETSGSTADDSTVFDQDATLSGTANWTTDCGGNRVFNFNGSSNYFSTTNASHLQPTESLSIAAWIYGDSWGSGSDVDAIVRKGDGNPNNYQLSVADGRVELGLDANDDAGTQSASTLSTGRWYHVTGTWDGATAKIYIDGVLNNSASRSGTIGTDTRPLYIGGRSGADYFDGMLRDVRLYNRALMQSEITMLAGSDGHWYFDEGSGSTAADSSGAGNFATLSGGATWTSDCAGNYALLTDGSGGIAETSSPFTPPDVGTVVFWMRSSGTPVGTDRLFGTGGDWEVRQMSDGTLVFDLCGEGGSNFATTTPLDEVDRWYHVAATFDSSNEAYAVFVDGVLHKSGTNSNSMSQQAANILSFGTRTGSTEYWAGALRDFRVYSRKLCATDIAQIYGLLGNWKLDETAGITAYDSSGMANNGTYTNGVTLAGTTGPIGGTDAAVFDGSNDYVSVGNESNYDVAGPITVAVWIKVSSFTKTWQAIFTKGDSAWRLSRNNATNTIHFACSGLSTTYVNGSENVNDGQWHHVAGVYDGDSLDLYFDGILDESVSTSGSVSTNGYNVEIGRNPEQSGREFHGAIYDPRVYNRALCPTEIAALADDGGAGFEGVKIIKWVEVQ